MTSEIIGKLWQLCGILRDAGITYPEYVTELTYLIFLKMAHETGTDVNLPKGLRWNDLASQTEKNQFSFYRKQLKKLGSDARGHVRAIFANAETSLQQPRHLKQLVEEFDRIDWYAAREESALADLYEGLLEKNSNESKAGAGQYFTPRPLVESIVDLIKPKLGEVVQDPACGTAGFLIAADRYIKASNKNFTGLSKYKIEFQRNNAFYGVEIVSQTHKLALMNALLHNVYGPIIQGDALGEAGENLPPADVILTNPPFGTKAGAGLPERKFPVLTSNKQLAFLQHVCLGLKPQGRAAIVLPDLQGKASSEVLNNLMDSCELHTILRLPTGIFYAIGVKTNVYFFNKGKLKGDNTKEVWIYDMRSNSPSFGKRRPLTRNHFADFEKAFGSDPTGKGPRKDQGTNGRFRCFSRKYIRENSDSLDIGWLPEISESFPKDDRSPDLLAEELISQLQDALKELKALQAETKP
jgi:type I restriction enzyme M protein